ncbi:MAG: ATP-binding protein [Acidobacteriota bacterium]|nr:ATP-binding protein [Acidobacteriota bacterium]
MSTQKSAGGKTTLPMTVKNTGFLLDRLGEDCHPLQHLRELTTNSIEAILRTDGKTGEIVWDVDWITYDLETVYKLSIIDNGIGMTGDEMVEYINQLSSSVSEQSLSGNYGVGAKIATATRNHAGVMYLSWKSAQGALIHLWRDPESGTYGLKQFDGKDQSFPYYITLEDEVKPDIIREHGTKIILLGNTPSQNTMDSPPDTPSPSRWISKYLNTRYFRFPKGVSIKVREGWEYPRTDRDRNNLRGITGQERYLNEHCEAKGTVKLPDAVASWWVLRDEPALGNNSGHIESAGHVAGLYQDELYEVITGRAGSAKLQNFGVIFGHRQVVIYVEPKSTQQKRVTTNTARTMLLVNNEPLPWTDWAFEFREKMPEEIKALVDQKAAASSVADHSKSIRERLKQILDLFNVSRYRPMIDGDVRIDEQNTTRGGKPRSEGTTTSGSGPSQSGGEGGTAGGVYSIFQKEGGTPGRRVQSDIFPEVRWISVKDGTRDIGMLEDRAARFLEDQNKLLINADFRVFKDMVGKFLQSLGGNEAFRDAVEDAVHGWFEQTLVETIIGVQALKNAKEWSLQDIEKALSEEALTTAVMPRYHVHNSVKRELGSRLGKLDFATTAGS